MKHSEKSPEVARKELEQGIKNAKAFGGRTGQRAENVLSDMLRSLKKYKRLTTGQQRYALSLIQQVDPEILKKRNEERQEWAKELKSDPGLQADILAVSDYYLAAGYYRNTARNCISWLNGGDQAAILPTKTSVMKMINNPYADKVKKSNSSAPIWSIGQLVCCRSTANGRFHLISGDGQYWRHAGDGVYTIIQVDSRPIDKALSYKAKQGGARYYRLLMLGSTRIIDVMEMDLKKVQKKLLK